MLYMLLPLGGRAGICLLSIKQGMEFERVHLTKCSTEIINAISRANFLGSWLVDDVDDGDVDND